MTPRTAPAKLSPTLHRRFKRTEKFISAVKRMKLYYKLGGGRRWSPERTVLTKEGGDCSWWALEILAKLGIQVNVKAGNTVSLAEEGTEGVGELLTLFIKNPPGEVDNEHVIIRMRRRRTFGILPRHRWTECGGSDNPEPRGGPTWFRPTAARIAEFPIRRHFPEFEAL
jgi:hypothetical protein